MTILSKPSTPIKLFEKDLRLLALSGVRKQRRVTREEKRPEPSEAPRVVAQ